MQTTTKGFLFFFLMVVSLFSCRKDDTENILTPSQFDKEKREELGDLLRFAIAKDTTNFPVLPNTSPNNITYEYLKALYQGQLTDFLRNHPKLQYGDEWTKGKTWHLTILDKDDVMAFILPGGHFYISKGFLLALTKEEQIYYTMAFEVSLMNEKVLLSNLFNEYLLGELTHVLNGNVPANGVTIDSLARGIIDLTYDSDEVKEIDMHAVNLLCNSSLSAKTGIIHIVDTIDPSEHWLSTRPSWGGRENVTAIRNLPLFDWTECPESSINGNIRYKENVLDILE